MGGEAGAGNGRGDDDGRRGGQTELLEREAEMTTLSTALSRARAGQGTLLVVEGSPGIGKSRLLQCAVEMGNEQEMLTLRARCAESERDFSFGGVIQLFERWLASGALAPEEAFSGAAALVRPLLEGRQLDAGAVSAQGLLHGLFWLTLNISSRFPLVLAVDDLHWADAGSVRFLSYLLPRIDELAVAAILTRRTGEPDEPEEVAELSRHPTTRRVTPAPLSADAVRWLVQDGLDQPAGERFGEACFRATGGNPLLVQAIIRSLRDDRIDPSDANAGMIAELRPELIRQQLLVRISRLGEDAMAAAAAAAVLGDDAMLAHVAALAGLDADAAARAADALVDAEILATAVPVRFAHPLLRSALYEQLPEAQRARTHVRAAAILQSEHAPAELIAAQLLPSTRVGEAWAARVLRDAATAALATGNVESAQRYLMRALREQLTARERAEALLALAEVRSLVGDPAAETHIAEALPLIEEPLVRARAFQALGNLRHGRGDRAAAAQAFEDGLAQLADEPDGELARDLHAGFFTVASLDPELIPRAIAHVTPLLQRPPGGETRGERGALAALAAHRASSGAPREEAIGLALRAWGDGALLAEEGPDGFAWHLVTGALGWNDELERTREIIDAVLEAARRRGSQMAYATATFTALSLAMFYGNLHDARAYGEAVQEARRLGWRAFAGTAAACHARVLIEQDELAEAERVLEVIAELEQSADRAAAVAARGHLRWVQDRPDDALVDLLEAGALFDQIGFVTPLLAPWRTDAAIVCHHLGEHERAAELIASAHEIARRTGTPSHHATALLAQARVSDAAQAMGLLGRALEVLRESGFALERLRCLAELGSIQRRSGRRSEARETLTGALDLAHRLGARRIEGRVHEELRIAGARPRRRRFSGPDALTASERRVANMAADGMGNREIAEALFVTPRTVEQHLYNTYKKLGIQSRTELGRALTSPGER